MSNSSVDLLIIGCGITGAALARDAAGRGLKVMVAEQNDYAAATSSGSSKLLHGALIYLDNFDISYMKSALRERDILIQNAPHLVREEKFFIPVIQSRSRAIWRIRLGLTFYDFLHKSKYLPKTGRLDAKDMGNLPHLRKEYLKAVFHYTDCHTKDNRLVVAQLLDARERGADINNNREVTSIEPLENGYRVSINDNKINKVIDARFIANVTGPWVNVVNKRFRGKLPTQELKLIRSSHIAIAMPSPAIETTYVLQNTDGRVLFAVPWNLGRYLIVGTTEVVHSGVPSQASCTVEEMAYLLAAYNTYFSHTKGLLRPRDVVWHWAGIRPFTNDGTHLIQNRNPKTEVVTHQSGNGCYMSVYGTNLMFHRQFAENLVTGLEKYGATVGAPWTKSAKLPGGSMTRNELLKLADKGPEELPLQVRKRWALLYGDHIKTMYDQVRSMQKPLNMVTPLIPEMELHHAVEKEDARNADDFLYRRTELFIDMDNATRQHVQAWFEQMNAVQA